MDTRTAMYTFTWTWVSVPVELAQSRRDNGACAVALHEQGLGMQTRCTAAKKRLPSQVMLLIYTSKLGCRIRNKFIILQGGFTIST